MKRRVLHTVRRIRKEDSMLSKLLLLKFVPSGWMTVGVGWLSLLNAARCLFGFDIPGMECPPDPGQALVSALTGLGFIGLGRRGQ